MDGAASIIAVVQITERVLTLCHEYIKGVKNAAVEIQNTESELKTLQSILKRATELYTGPHKDKLEIPQSLVTALAACLSDIDKIKVKLEGDSKPARLSRIFQQLKWPMRRKEFEEFILVLQKHQANVSANLGIDQTIIAADNRDILCDNTAILLSNNDTLCDNTIKLNENQEILRDNTNILHSNSDLLSENNDVLRESNFVLLDHSDILYDHSQKLDDSHNILLGQLEAIKDSERLDILNWISPISFGAYHDRVADARSSGTCNWILKKNEFPGVGKTYLTSKVVDHLQDELRQSNDEGFAFFYCDRNEEEYRKPLSVLQSFTRQLSTPPGRPGDMQTCLRDVWRTSREAGRSMSYNMCKSQLLKSVDMYSRTTLVLDALDECERVSRASLIDAIEYLISESKMPIRVFISSRPDSDIRALFTKLPSIEMQATDNQDDIILFVHEEIAKHHRWKTMRKHVKEGIIKTLLAQSHGMFQWVYLQIRQLLEVHTERAIQNRIGKLPNSLRGAYDEIYNEIGTGDVYEKSVVDRVFKWLMCAHKPMSRLQLLQAVSIDYTRPRDRTELIATDDVLGLCRNMVIFDGTHWKFAHLSVREYLEETHCSLRHAHLYAAKLCLSFALEVWKKPRIESKIDDKTTGPAAFSRKPPPVPPTWPFQSKRDVDPLPRKLSSPSSLGLFPLGTVKPKSVGRHSPRTTPSSTMNMSNPFLSTSNADMLNQFRSRPLPAERRIPSDRVTVPARGKHVSDEAASPNERRSARMKKNSSLGARTVNEPKHSPTSDELNDSDSSIGGPDSVRRRYPLGDGKTIDWSERLEILQHQMRHRKDFSVPGNGAAQPTPLSSWPKMDTMTIATATDDESIDFHVKNLPTHDVGINVHAKNPATDIESIDVHVKNLPTDDESVDAHGINPWSAARRYDQGSFRAYVCRWWITHLYREEAENDPDPELVTLLRRFLGAPGDSSVAYRNWLEEARSLRDDAPGYSTSELFPSKYSILIACRYSLLRTLGSQWWNKTSLTKSLLATKNDNGDDLLTLAAASGQIPVCELLLGRGLFINTLWRKDEFSCAPLVSAAKSGHHSMVQFLEQRGANVNLTNGPQGQTALCAAVENGRADIVQFLLEQNADANVESGPLYGSALAAAAAKDDTAVMQLLLAHGADPNMRLRQGKCGSALIGAATVGAAKLLIEAGADANAQVADGPYRCALTAHCGHVDIFQYLLDAGAQLTTKAQVMAFEVALNRSLENQDPRAFQSLVKKVVKVKLEDRDDVWKSALLRAVLCRDYDIIQYLLDNYTVINHNKEFLEVLLGFAVCAAAEKGSLDVLRYLDQRGVEVKLDGEARLRIFESAIGMARTNSHTDVVQYLVGAGAEISARGPTVLDKFKQSLYDAAREGSLVTLELLMDGPDLSVDLPLEILANALVAAAECVVQNEETISYLIGKPVYSDVQLKRDHLSRALIGAVARKCDWAFHALLKHGAELKSTKGLGKFGSPLVAAAIYDDQDLYFMKNILASNVDVNAAVPEGEFGSALAAACAYGRQQTIEELLRAGANDDRSLDTGLYGSALAAAAYWGHTDCVEILLEAGANANMELVCDTSHTVLTFSKHIGKEFGTSLTALSYSRADIPVAKLEQQYDQECARRGAYALERAKADIEKRLRLEMGLEKTYLVRKKYI
ncbi:nacht and ankyrin domain protein [Ophiostoma piceae UAMH 11346]|uniref:Nacht and ankyrin domain protein n=1 Tax=Ophiostoma piceae (strain UAMH 11346) TaxID=1262450 RepID=S3CZZ0_OPHP1|nr:nacht and ankyrin domain protein [Ophiostoma piceae UAMH 11346]